MIADIINDYQYYSGTPGAGDWELPLTLAGLQTDELNITITITINGILDRGPEIWLKPDTYSSIRLPIDIPALTATDVVAVYIKSSNLLDTDVTLSGSIQRASANVLAMDQSVIVAIEAVLADDAAGEAIKQAIIDKLIENLPDLNNLSVAAIRNDILNRPLAGNHDIPGTPGKLLQNVDATVSSRLASADYSISSVAAGVWGYEERTLSDFSDELVAVIWTYDDRTLTGTSMGLGPAAARARVDGYAECPTGGTIGLYRRVLGWDGADLQQADISSITYSIFVLSGDDLLTRTAVTGHQNVALDATEVLFDTVQSDEWASNYNFRHIPEIDTNAAFAAAGTLYLVEYTITPATGQAIVDRIKVRAI